MALTERRLFPRLSGEAAVPTTNRGRSQVEERRIAKVLGARLQPNSGAGGFPSKKGDMVREDFLIEHKLTDKPSFSVSASVLRKIVSEASRISKQPLLVVTVQGMPEHLPQDWAVLPLGILKDLLGEA